MEGEKGRVKVVVVWVAKGGIVCSPSLPSYGGGGKVSFQEEEEEGGGNLPLSPGGFSSSLIQRENWGRFERRERERERELSLQPVAPERTESLSARSGNSFSFS